MEKVKIVVGNDMHVRYAEQISQLIKEAAAARGTGIAERKQEYIANKLHNGNAVIALSGEKLAGFCYIETWSHGKYVAHSGLIVSPDFRNQGLAKQIKRRAFELSRKKFPHAKIFGLTTSLAVMKINSELGYKPVTFSELTDDEEFWKGCSSCSNYDILQRTNKKYCLCTGMIHEPVKKKNNKPKKVSKPIMANYERWLKLKRYILMKKWKKKQTVKI